MPQRTKYSQAEKVEIVWGYMSGEQSASEVKHIKGISYSTLYEWVRLYKLRGAEGLQPVSKTRKYSAELKALAVMEYINGKASLLDICTKYDITDNHILRRWIKKYNCHEDFKHPKSEGATYMTIGRATTFEERIEIVSHCISNNKDYGKTTKQYGVSYQQIYGWVRKYEKDGASSLIDRRGKRKPESTMSEVDKLQANLKLKEAEISRLRMENELLKKLEELERGLIID